MATHDASKEYGIPVGAVLIPCKQVQQLRSIIMNKLRVPNFTVRSAEKRDCGMLLMHLPPAAVALFIDGDAELTNFLRRHEGEFIRVRRKRPMGRASDAPGLCLPPKQKKQKTKDQNPRFTFVELFAGIGGFRIGLERNGGKCTLASELKPQATTIYRQFFGDQNSELIEGDMLDLGEEDFPNTFTMLTGGFPCQPFSTRGQRRGLDDDRGQLYQELVRVLMMKQPPLFLFENVAGLVTMDGGSRSQRTKGQATEITAGNVMEKILQAFRACGYKVEWRIVNARHFVPQYRERVYFVGSRLDLQCEDFHWDKLYPNEKPPVLRNVLEPTSSPSVTASELSTSQWEKVQSLYEPKEEKMVRLDDFAPTLISSYHKVGSFSNKYVGEEVDGTVRDGLGRNPRPRFLTPRECCRIMGFPEDFPVPTSTADPAHFYQGIGNAVVPPVIASIGEQMMTMYEKALARNGKDPVET
jgi:DNA (cytosine-5)-methyltransferase 1